MGAKVLQEKTFTTVDFDQTFLAIFKGQCLSASEEARNCTGSIFTLTSKYLNQSEFEVLQQFYDLYFVPSEEVEKKKDAINQEVDDLFSMLQGQMSRGEELSVPDEDEAKKQARLSLSAIQKKLESLITLDGGIRDQVLPALSSMQCEDAVKQRVDHLVFGWSAIITAGNTQITTDWEAIAREIAKKTSSVEESEDYYKTVLGEKAPEGSADRSVFIEF